MTTTRTRPPTAVRWTSVILNVAVGCIIGTARKELADTETETRALERGTR